MNDIVESMRYCASVSDGSKCAGCKYGIQAGGDCVEGLLSEAADEIEFLNKVIEVERKEHKEALEAERKKHNLISVKDRLPKKEQLTHETEELEKRTVETLKPCPFCGGEAELIEKYNRFYEVQDVFVKCKKCGVRSVSVWNKNIEMMRNLVVEVWNKRVTDSENACEVEE